MGERKYYPKARLKPGQTRGPKCIDCGSLETFAYCQRFQCWNCRFSWSERAATMKDELELREREAERIKASVDAADRARGYRPYKLPKIHTAEEFEDLE
jgi:integrase